MVPEPIEDPELGRFTWDGQYKFWLGKIEEPAANPAYLTIHVGPSDRAALLALAREAVARVRQLEAEARRFAAGELFQAQHTGKVEATDIDRVVCQMVLNSVSAEPNGMLELAYENEELFGGTEFIVWFDGDRSRGVTILDDSPLSKEGECDSQ